MATTSPNRIRLLLGATAAAAASLVFVATGADSQRTSISSIQMDIEDLETMVVPIGGVLLWWGDSADIPFGFELCDGLQPQTQGATLLGLKPDLRERFAKGAPSGVDVQALETTGGTTTIADLQSGSVAISATQLPSHAHSISSSTSNTGSHGHATSVSIGSDTHTHSINIGRGDAGQRDRAADGDASGGAGSFSSGGDTHSHSGSVTVFSSGSHTHTVSGNTGNAGSNGGHSHLVNGHDNQPPFLELHYIIRVL